MRLLITIPHFLPAAGGAESFAVTVCNALAGRNHEIHVAATNGNRSGTVEVHRLGKLSEATALADTLQPDITLDWGLHTRADVHRLGGGTHRQFLKYKLLSYPAFLRPLKALEMKFSRKHRRLIDRERRLLSDSGASYIAVSNFVAGQLRDSAPVDDERIHILHNGVSCAKFGEQRDTAALRRELGLEADDIVCLFVAHNLRLKNFQLLKKVFRLVAPQTPKLKLVVLGKRRPPAGDDWLLYAGTRSDPVPFYHMADILLHPTYYDACANVVIEALAAGCVVVSSNLNGSAELLSSGIDGFMLPVTQTAAVHEWSALLEWLIREKDMRRQISAAAQDLAGQYDIDNYVRRLENILESAAAHPRRQPFPL